MTINTQNTKLLNRYLNDIDNRCFVNDRARCMGLYPLKKPRHYREVILTNQPAFDHFRAWAESKGIKIN